MYEYGTLKTVEVILRKGMGEEKIMEEMKQTWVQYMYLWKYHNELPCISITYQ
jgi:hypothetical protein